MSPTYSPVIEALTWRRETGWQGTHRDLNHNAKLKNQLFSQSWAHELVWKIKRKVVKYYLNTKAIYIPQKVNLNIYKSLTESDESWCQELEPENVSHLLVTAITSSIQGGYWVKEQKHLPFQLLLYIAIIVLGAVQTQTRWSLAIELHFMYVCAWRYVLTHTCCFRYMRMIT